MEKVLKIVSHNSTDSDRSYWMKKTPEELLEAIEFLRNQYIQYKYKDVHQRLQRVCRIIKEK